VKYNGNSTEIATDHNDGIVQSIDVNYVTTSNAADRWHSASQNIIDKL